MNVAPSLTAKMPESIVTAGSNPSEKMGMLE